jgi:sulfatase modifying factor 1
VVLSAILVLVLDQGFVQVRAGRYFVGKADRLDSPPRLVKSSGFNIAKFETTNEQFREFVAATNYITDAERLHNAMVFEPGLKEFRWIHDRTASWQFPNGITRGGIESKKNHPVTSISFRDAQAYSKWAKVRLPSLNEWEIACRAGTKTDLFFGEDASQIAKYANIWHGQNHLKPDNSDGYLYTSPVGTFLPNPWGLYDMYGNVFEFCTGRLPSDRHNATRHSRGGSWWCSANSCCAFNSVDIGSVNEHASFSNQGFRVVKL